MGISAGEIYSLRELLYGMLLNSGNDAATAVAEGVAEDEKTFVEWMNIRASELGLINTYFADPSGLDDSSYSTAEDLTVLAHFALEHEEFRNIVRTVEKEYSYSEEHKYISLYNQTNLLTTYPGVLGVKTGYTEEAGLCLVTYAVNEGREIIGVVLNSIDRKGDMIRMLDSGFSGMGIRVEHHLLD
jgi:D-alanyl-D-alanine carboxypeptidase (penicillin-binding protein 5/6)